MLSFTTGLVQGCSDGVFFRSFVAVLPRRRYFLNFDVFCSTSDQQCNRFVLLPLEVLLCTLCNWCLLVGFLFSSVMGSG